MTSGPDVSVIIPTIGRWELLSTTLRGALYQRDVEAEIIVVDDGSTDETAGRLAEIGDPRMRVMRHESPQGVARARNHAIAEARGEWLAFLDDDDLWSPRKLRAQLDAASEAKAEWVYAQAVVVVVDERRSVLEPDLFPSPSEISRLLLTSCVIPGGGSNVVAKTALVRRLGSFDERLSVLADWDLWIRLSQAAMAAACPEVLIGYRLHSGSMHVVERDRALWAEFGLLSEKHRRTAVAAGVEFDWLSFLEWRAVRERWAGRRMAASRAYLRSAWTARSPAMLIRAIAVLLGERAMRFGKRLLRGQEAAPLVPRPAWLDLYRQ